jgi:DNA-binding HxlR family transcriptional regulator
MIIYKIKEAVWLTAKMENLFESFVDPIDCRILLAVTAEETTTTKQLLKALPDIPQATLYRRLGKLVQKGVLRVVQERKVRALTEKVYAMNMEFDQGVSEMVKENRGDVYLSMFAQFTGVLMREFAQYAARDDIDILHDGSGFSTSPVAVNEEELRELSMKMSELLALYRTPEQLAKPGRKLHSLAIVITPPKAENE